MLRRLACSLGLVTVGFVLGCGGGAPAEKVPPLEPVSGKVMLDGQPAVGVSVTFFPMEKGNPATATTDETGAYKLKHRTGAEGTPEGNYQVLFSKMTQADGSPIPPDKTAADVAAIDQIPPGYRTMDNPMLARTIPKGGTTFDFEIATK